MCLFLCLTSIDDAVLVVDISTMILIQGLASFRDLLGGLLFEFAPRDKLRHCQVPSVFMLPGGSCDLETAAN